MIIVERPEMRAAAPLRRPQPREAEPSETAPLANGLHIAPSGLRRYAPDSAHAAARIVALALISNGKIKSVEAATLDAVEAHAMLGMPREEWYAVLGQLRLDLLQVNRPRGASVSGRTLERVLDDVTDKDLRRIVAALCVAVIHADRRVAPGEQTFLAALQRKWGVPVHLEPCALLLRERALLRKRPQGDTPGHLAAMLYTECRPEHPCGS